MSIPHRNRILIPLAALALLFLSACGNKGPLVMPQKPVPVEEQAVEPASEATVPEDTNATDDPPVVPDPVDPQLDNASDDDGNE